MQDDPGARAAADYGSAKATPQAFSEPAACHIFPDHAPVTGSEDQKLSTPLHGEDPLPEAQSSTPSSRPATTNRGWRLAKVATRFGVIKTETLLGTVMYHWVTQIVTAVMIILNVFAAVMETTSESNKLDEWPWILFLITTVFFTVEIVLLAVHHGPILWIRDVSNVVDVTTVILCWLGVIWPKLFCGFGSLRILRILRLLVAYGNMTSIGKVLDSLTYNPKFMGVLGVYFVAVLLFFGIFGLEMYFGSLDRRCTFEGVAISPEAWCTVRGTTKGYNCASSHVCVTDFGNPFGNHASFDNIGETLLVVFGIMSTSTWRFYTDALMEAEYTVSIFYPIAIIVVLTFLVVNLFVACICFGFSASEVDDALAEQDEEEKEAALAAELASEDTIVEAELAAAQATLVTAQDSEDPEAIAGAQQAVTDAKTRGGIRLQMRQIFETRRFEWALLGCIFINMAVLATIKPDMATWHSRLFDISEIFFTVLFLAEMILKIFAYGWVRYIRAGWNKFDFVITLLSVFSVIVDFASASKVTGGFMVFRALRMFRILRVTRGIKQFNSVHATMNGLTNSFPSLLAVLAVLCIVFMIFGTIGHDLFKDKMGISRQNFDTFLNSILVLSQIVTADGWEPLMYKAMDADKTSWAAVPFFIIFWMISSFILLNLVIASILDAVQANPPDDFEEEQDAVIEETTSDQMSSPDKNLRHQHSHLEETNEGASVKVHPKEGTMLGSPKRDEHPENGPEITTKPDTDPPAPTQSRASRLARFIVDFTIELPYPSWDCSPPAEESDSMKFIDECKFSWGSTEVNWFKFTMLCHVLASNVVLIFDTAGKNNDLLNEESDSALTLYLLFVFTVELILKLMAHGLLTVPVSNKVAPATSLEVVPYEIKEDSMDSKEDSMDSSPTDEKDTTEHPVAYLRSPWNVIDCLVLFMSYIDVMTGCVGISGTSCATLRAGRLARPFRVIGHFSGMQQVIVAFARSCPSLLSVLVVSNGIYFCFAVIGVEMFGHMLRWCNDNTMTGKFDCVGTYTVESGILAPREWVLWSRNFDNLAEAYLTLFEVASLDEWAEVLYKAIDMTEVDKQPSVNSSSWAAIFFLAFVFFGSLFVLQLLVTIVIDMYSKSNGIGSLGWEQQAYLNLEQMKEFLSPAGFPKRPKGTSCSKKFRQLCYDTCIPWDSNQSIDITQSKSCCSRIGRVVRSYFDNFITTCIFINLGLQCTRHRSQSDTWEAVLFIGDVFFLLVFVIELVVRITAYTPKVYFKDTWNIVDAGVVLVSVLATPFKSKITRGCRVLRMIRLLKNIEMFKMITTVMIQSVKQISNVLLVLMLIMFAWAVFGIEKFGNVKYGAVLDRHSNFKDFTNAIYVLTQVMFSSWIYIRKDCRIQPPACTLGEDCGSWMATPYFLLYVTINCFIMINMCVAVVLGNFAWIYATEKSGPARNEDGSQQKKVQAINANHLRNARRIWDNFDRRGTGFILQSDLSAFLLACGSPLGLDPCRTPICVQEHGKVSCNRRVPCPKLPPLLVSQLKNQCAAFPLAKKGFCRFQDLVTSRLVGHMGDSVIDSEHVLASRSAPIQRFRAAIELIIDQRRVAKHLELKRTRTLSNLGKETPLPDGLVVPNTDQSVSKLLPDLVPLDNDLIVPLPPVDDPLDNNLIVPLPPVDDPLDNNLIVPLPPADDPLDNNLIVPLPPDARPR